MSLGAVAVVLVHTSAAAATAAAAFAAVHALFTMTGYYEQGMRLLLLLHLLLCMPTCGVPPVPA
jgi:hypothetical protein